MQDDARARIYDLYDKANKRGVYAECTDPDSDDFYLTPAEKKKALDEQLAADESGSPLARRKAAEARIYANKEEPTPEAAPDDGREPAHQAVDAFLEKNPEFQREAEWKTLRKTALESMPHDLFALRQKAEKTGRAADFERLLTRAAEIAPGEKQQAERRAAAEKMARDRFPIKV